ncbi:undecaprenyl-phosphate glucose phosphotransferase [Burkholderia sp. BCC0405]|uniref:undecaprenyl-phosphate glucose phosphotransferase n=1 Tax=Burkholderia sp. BCC0405 TaxID=2676298 RepID=UPI00158D8A6E|nr:undecaprenyl-phosphate glucose phosphotransferase [Burkholderia sp. BCC0405]
MQKNPIRHRELIVFLIDIGMIVTIAMTMLGESMWSLAALRTETLLVASSALFATFLLSLSDRTLNDAGARATRYLLRTLALWLVAQGSVFAMMIALSAVSLASVAWFIRWTFGVAIALLAFRIGLFLWRCRRLRAPRRHRAIAIVGTGERIARLAAGIGGASSPFRLVAICQTSAHDTPIDGTLPVVHDLAAFSRQARQQRASEIWIALPLSDEHTIVSVIDEFRHDFVDMRLLPDVSQLALFGSQVDEILGEPAISLAVSPLSLRARMAKAVFDRVFAAAALIVLMPLLLAIGVAVKLSSPGPVFFTQKRRGADGETFDIYKFRTMKLHVERDGTVAQATRGDPRVTAVGALLRRTSLDELPQFINVLLGDMSVVGPRPHAVEHDAQYRTLVDGYIHRYRIKPGITGWAQVNGLRGATEHVERMQSRIEYDLYYLRNWSFSLDLRIIGATVLKGIVHPNAY